MKFIINSVGARAGSEGGLAAGAFWRAAVVSQQRLPCTPRRRARGGEAGGRGAAPEPSFRDRAAAHPGRKGDGPWSDDAREGAFARTTGLLALTASRPWHCSPRVLRLIVALALSREEAGSVVEREGGADAEEQPGEALRVLIDRVTTSARAAHRLARALDAALVGAASSYSGLCVSELASRWERARAAAPPEETAALLWASARMPGSPLRLLEERIADDVEVRALQALATSGKAAGATRWPSAKRRPSRAVERHGERGIGAVGLAGRGRQGA
jgi:hypothetical protein